MSVKLPAYDVKLLVKKLEVEVGRPMTEFVASTSINVILKWIEKSVILSDNKVDDVVIAIYPALIKFLSKKIDLKEFTRTFEMEKEWDITVLLKQLEIGGLIIAEESAVRVIEVCLTWVKDSAELSENPYDDIVSIVIPVVLKPLNDMVNGISEEVESKIDLDKEEVVQTLAPVTKKKVAKKKVTKKK